MSFRWLVGKRKKSRQKGSQSVNFWSVVQTAVYSNGYIVAHVSNLALFFFFFFHLPDP